MKTVDSNPNMTNWNPDDGYGQRVGDDDYPIRVFNAQLNAFLYLHLKLFEKDLEWLCRGTIQGFKVFLSSPGDSFKMSRNFLRIPFSEKSTILVTPRLITTSQKLRNYLPNERQCYFNTERKLRFFNIYSQNNCQSECLANFTDNVCGCVKFSMPSILQKHSIFGQTINS